jgi:hypothetical protein
MGLTIPVNETKICSTLNTWYLLIFHFFILHVDSQQKKTKFLPSIKLYSEI